MAPDIVLSICIPTFNRVGNLDVCLKNILGQVGNNKQVEVVIADNASTDNTKEVATFYSSKYNNVNYFRNDTNIGGNANILHVLKLGKGEYLKLMNDYGGFIDGGALKMLEIVKSHLENKEILYFANGVSYLKKKDFYYSKNLDEFLRVCSFHSQWILTIGFWNEDFKRMMNYYEFKSGFFFQTELLFENFNLGKKAVTYSREIFKLSELENKKVPFNFFDIFINSYFNNVIVGLKDKKRISKSTFRKEKNRFFSDWVFSWYKNSKDKEESQCRN
jgi:abequosyltransferase